MLLGIWRSFEELEDSISVEELESILITKREKDNEDKKFLAALKGIDLDEGTENEKTTGEEALERVKRRVESKMKGENPDIAEFAEFGIKFSG